MKYDVLLEVLLVATWLLLAIDWGRGRLCALRKLTDLAGLSLAVGVGVALAAGWFGRGPAMWALVLCDVSALIRAAMSLGLLSVPTPSARLWRLNQEAAATMVALATLPNDAALSKRLSRLAGRIEDVRLKDAPRFALTLAWRYYDIWDPAHDCEMAKLREVYLDQLEREVWPPGSGWSSAELDESTFVRGLHLAVGELVQHGRDTIPGGDDPLETALIARVESFRRADTAEIIDVVIERTRHREFDTVDDVQLPLYRLPDGLALKRSCFDRCPPMGTQLTESQLDELEGARRAMVDRLVSAKAQPQ